MTSLPALFPALLSVLLKGFVILAVATAAAYVLSRGPAALRHAVWVVALALLVTLPVAEWMLPHWSPLPSRTTMSVHVAPPSPPTLPVLPTPPAAPTLPGLPNLPTLPSPPDATPSRGADANPDAEPKPVPDVNPDSESSGSTSEDAEETELYKAYVGPPRAQPDPTSDASQAEEVTEEVTAWTTLVATARDARTAVRAWGTSWLAAGFVLVWGMGAVAGLLWVGVGLGQVVLWTRRAERVTDDAWTARVDDVRDRLSLSADVRVYRAPDVTVPMTAGWRRPVVLLPCSSATWPEARRRMVLLHELAHVKRGDYVTNLLAHVVRALHWMNPLVWLAVKRLRAEREQACDDHVLSTGVDAPDYADQLVAIARAMLHRERIAGALAMAEPSEITQRVHAILDGAPRTLLSRGRAALVVGIAALLFVPLAALSPAPGASAANTADPTAPVGLTERPTAPARAETSVPQIGVPSPAPVAVPDTTDDPIPTPQADERRRMAEVEVLLQREQAEEMHHAAERVREEAALVEMEATEMQTHNEALQMGMEDVRARAARATADTSRSDSLESEVARQKRKVALQRNAVAALADGNAEQALPRLLDIARTHSNAEIRAYAIRQLDEFETEAVADALVSFVNSETTEVEKTSAIYALDDFPDDLAVPRLIQIGQTHPDPDIRRRVVYELDDFDTDTVADALVSFVETDPSAAVREHAIYALDDLSAERAVSRLIQIGRTHPDDETRRRAVYALDAFDTDEVTTALNAFALSEDAIEIRLAAVQSIGDLSEERAIPALLDILETVDEDRVRARAVRVLGDFDDPRATEALMSIINEE